MTSEQSPEQQLDAELDRVLADYLEKLDQGVQYSPEQLLADHPEMTQSLREFLTTSDRVEAMAGPSLTEYLRNQLAEPQEPIDQRSVETTSNANSETQVHPGKPTRTANGLEGQFGRYEIIRRLGAGGMGEVYLARDTELDRMVALKTPRLDAANDETLDRFLREARTAAKIHHPNICSVFDVGQIDRIYYVTMAFIEGEELEHQIKESKLDIQAAIELTKKIALAVGEAHQHGVIHRDLKPANVMIDHRGEPVVMDFGLAREVKQAAGDQLTRAGSILGSPAYMAPEQLQTKGKVGPGMDIYALGVILYEMLTGRRPFGGSFEELAGQVLFADPQPPRELRKEVSPALEQVVLKMLAKEPDDRYQTMDEVIAALDQATISSSGAGSGIGRYVAIGGGLLGVLAILLTVIINIEWEDGTKTKLDVPNNATVKVDTKNKQVTVRTGSDDKKPLKIPEPHPDENPGQYALEFDGKDDYVQLPMLPIDLSKPITIEAIVQPEHRGDQFNGSLFSLGTSINLYYEAHVRNKGELGWRPWFSNQDRKSTIPFTEATAGGQKYHVAFVYTGNWVVPYINGRKQGGPGPLKGPLQKSEDPPRIGVNWREKNPFKGKIFALKISQEIRYRDSFDPPDSLSTDADTIALYNFNQGSGDQLLDASGNRHHGKIVGATWLKFENLAPTHAEDFEEWIKKVVALPAEEKLKAFAKKLQELNPGFDADLKYIVNNGVVRELRLSIDQITDISPIRVLPNLIRLHFDRDTGRKGKLEDLSPLRGLRLVRLSLNNTSVSDLTPLKGMPIKHLDCGSTDVSDLSPLMGMPLDHLFLDSTPISDLSPLRGMPLEYLFVSQTKISDLTPLAGMPLKYFRCDQTDVSDLSPLTGMPLIQLGIHETKVQDLSPLSSVPLQRLHLGNTQVSDIQPLMEIPIKHIGLMQRSEKLNVLRKHETLQTINGMPAEDFWKEWDDQAVKFEQWIEQVSELPAEQQIEAVAKKLQELNPGFDGKVDFQIRAPNNIKLTIYTFDVKDISPIRAIKGLQELDCVGTGSQEGTLVDISPLRDTGIKKLYLRYNRITDLSPLRDLKLESLSVERNPVRELEPLRNMPLTYLNCGFSNVADLSPLEGMPLEFLNCQATQVSDLSPLSEMPLKELYCGSTQVSSLAPLRETNLTNLLAGNTQIRDLTPLRGMPLIELGVHYSPVSDLSPLKGMQLEQLRIWHTEVKNVELLTDMPLKKLWITPEKLADISPVRTLKNLEHINGQPPAEFWKEWNQQ